MKLTVIIPMFNEAAIASDTAKTLTDSLESWAAANDCTYQLLFSNDGSGDNCGDIVRAFAADVSLSAAKSIAQSSTPVLIIQAESDETIPPDSVSIYSHKEEITSPKVEYMLCDAGHTDVLYDDDGTANDALIEEIHYFLLRSTVQ